MSKGDRFPPENTSIQLNVKLKLSYGNIRFLMTSGLHLRRGISTQSKDGTDLQEEIGLILHNGSRGELYLAPKEASWVSLRIPFPNFGDQCTMATASV